jgi:uncharacterized membrane protein
MAEDLPSRATLEALVERLDHLERVLQANTARLHAVERRLESEHTPLERRAHAARPPASSEETADAPRPATISPMTPPPGARNAPHTPSPQNTSHATGPRTPPHTGRAQTASPRPATEPRASQAGRERRDLESVIGGVWFAWAGIIAVVFTVAFTLKQAFDNDWIGPGARVTLGALSGLALLALGERLRRRGLRAYAHILSGGGLLILYLSIYAAYNFYELLGQSPAFLLMALVTAAAVLLAVRLGAPAIAVLGLVGGFLTPVLISTGQDNQVALFTYVSLLDAGVLAVAYFRRWRSLDFLSFAGTALVTLGWALKFYNAEKLWTTLFFLTLFFILYALLAVFHNVLPRRTSRWFDVALLASNATLYFGFSYILLMDAGHERVVPASQALLVSSFFTLLFYAVWRRSRADRLLSYAYVGAAVTFFTVALAISLELYWVTVAWAVEGLMLTWVGLRSDVPAPRRFALAVFGLGVLHWLAFDAQRFALSGGDFVPLFNPRALSCAVLVGALGAAAWLYRRERVRVEGVRVEGDGEVRGVSWEEERTAAATLLALAANALAVTLLTLDLSDYFGRRKALAEGFEAERVENARQFSLSALWSIYGVSLVAYGVRRNFRAVHFAGLALLALATIKVPAFDLTYYDAPWHVPVLNHTFMAFALLVAAYALAVRLYARKGSVAEDGPIVPVLLVVANLLALVALSAEAAGYFDSRMAAELRGGAGLGGAAGTGNAPPGLGIRLHDLQLAKQVSLSVVWTLYGAGLLLVGRVRRSRLLRLMALALLGLTTLKVFFWDLSYLDRVYRIVSFIVLGAILLAVSYLYQKSRQSAAAEEREAAAEETEEAAGEAGAYAGETETYGASEP